MPNGNVYALLVGIDKYLPPVPALEGCVNDMLAIKQFLESRVDPPKLRMEVLMDADATRMNIVDKFEAHLGQAGPDDVAFFYYSGHGSQEPAHEVFWATEPDKLNETLVCYDSRLFDGMDLADKELATLIDLVSQKNPHFLVIMDCCHSGSGTRSIGDEFVARQSPEFDRVRSLDSYILPRNMSADRSAFVAGDQQVVVPEGRHVALVGSQSFQLAKETRLGGTRRGVFTYSLLEVLQNATGSPSYSEVMRRVQTLVTQRTYDQVPQLYTKVEGDMDRTFLGGAVKAKGEYYFLTYDHEKGWTIDGGAVHGIQGPSFRGNSTTLAVYQEHTELEEMTRATSLGEITVLEVGPAESKVELSRHLQLETDRAYRVRVISMPINPMKIRIKGDNAEGIRLAHKALDRSQQKFFIQEVKANDEANYNLVASRSVNGYVINRPSDETRNNLMPLVEQIIGFNEETAEKAIDNLEHIARWNRILETSNPMSSIHSDAVRMELYPLSENFPIPVSQGGAVFTYRKSDGAAGLPRFRLKIINTSHRRLYCTLLYMSSQFAIYTQLFPEGGIWLDSGTEAWAINGKIFTAEVADGHISFGRNEVNEIFKLIVSTEEYKSGTLRQKELNVPKEAQKDIMGVELFDTRSLMFADPVGGDKADWNTSEMVLTIRRED